MPVQIVALLFALSPLAAASEPAPPVAPYAGHGDRAVASLSAEDLETLRLGGGWGSGAARGAERRAGSRACAGASG